MLWPDSNTSLIALSLLRPSGSQDPRTSKPSPENGTEVSGEACESETSTISGSQETPTDSPSNVEEDLGDGEACDTSNTASVSEGSRSIDMDHPDKSSTSSIPPLSLPTLTENEQVFLVLWSYIWDGIWHKCMTRRDTSLLYSLPWLSELALLLLPFSLTANSLYALIAVNQRDLYALCHLVP